MSSYVRWIGGVALELCAGMNQSEVLALFRQGKVRLNGAVVPDGKAWLEIGPGDEVEIEGLGAWVAFLRWRERK